MCGLLGQLSTKFEEDRGCRTNRHPLEDSYTTEGVTSKEQLSAMANTWIGIEDESCIVEAEVDDLMGNLDAMEVELPVCNDEGVNSTSDDELSIDEVEDRDVEAVGFNEVEEAINVIRGHITSMARHDAESAGYNLERCNQIIQKAKLESIQANQPVITTFFASC